MIKLPTRKDALPRSFYESATEVVGRQLIGKALLHRVDGDWIGGLIVETESYLADNDAASHSARGQTKSNASMFARPGTLYVYPIHAKFCLNAVTESEGRGTAVLVRAIEPIWGIEKMQEHRGYEELRRLTRGPAMLCQALAVDRSHDGIDLINDKQFRIANASTDPSVVVVTQRIGISKAKELALRFVAKDSRFASR